MDRSTQGLDLLAAGKAKRGDGVVDWRGAVIKRAFLTDDGVASATSLWSSKRSSRRQKR